MSETKMESMEAWIDAIAEHNAAHRNGDNLPSHALLDCPDVGPLLLKAREIDDTISSLKDALAAAERKVALLDELNIGYKDALAAAEAKACGLAEALELTARRLHGYAIHDIAYADCTKHGCDTARTALTDARCTHAERVETLERELAFAKAVPPARSEIATYRGWRLRDE